MSLGTSYCQGTLIFSNISTIYSSFPSATFHFTSLYFSSKTSTIIFNHLQASPSTTLSSLLPFVILSSVLLSFTFLISHQVDSELTQTLPITPISISILTYIYFYLHFYLHFPMLLSGDTQSHLGPLALFCKYVVLGSISIYNFSVNMSHLEPLPSATMSVNTSPLDAFPLVTFL